MDKYQKLLVQKARIKEWLYFENNGVSDEESSRYWKRVVFDENIDSVAIIQVENPNIVEYILIVFGESFINAIEVYKKSKWEKIKKSTFKTRWAAFRLNIKKQTKRNTTKNLQWSIKQNCLKLQISKFLRARI